MTDNTLSPKTIEVVKATAPVLAEHGLQIVKTFYPRMHRENPEVAVRFNPANQVAGEAKTRASQQETFRSDFFSEPASASSQQGALTAAVYGYAANIDNLEALTPAVMRIAHKHVSLDIKPEQYPIIGNYLLAAIKEVLGDAATDEIMDAWKEAYFFLADLFITIENGLRQSSAQKSGGWDGFRPFVVARKTPEAENVYSFYLEPQDGGSLPDYQAGQYTCFRVAVPGFEWAGGNIVYRNYSLSTAPGKGYFRVTIQREPGAKGNSDGVCSNYFHDHVAVGDVLNVAPPYGPFALVESSRPQVFIAGGMGITTMFSLFQSVVDNRLSQPIYFVQCMRNSQHHPLKQETQDLAQQGSNVTVHRCYSEPAASDRPGEDYNTRGRLNLEVLQQLLPDNDGEFYFTGPVGFMRHVRTMLHTWGVPAERVHYECYGPHAADIEADIS